MGQPLAGQDSSQFPGEEKASPQRRQTPKKAKARQKSAGVQPCIFMKLGSKGQHESQWEK